MKNSENNFNYNEYFFYKLNIWYLYWLNRKIRRVMEETEWPSSSRQYLSSGHRWQVAAAPQRGGASRRSFSSGLYRRVWMFEFGLIRVIDISGMWHTRVYLDPGTSEEIIEGRSCVGASDSSRIFEFFFFTFANEHARAAATRG